MNFNRKLFKEAFIRGYKEAKRRLNETSIDTLRKKHIDKYGSTDELGDNYLRNDSGFAQYLKWYQGLGLLRGSDAKKNLENYARHYSRLLSLIEYISSIYRHDGSNAMSKKEAQEVYKTFEAVREDLIELQNMVKDGYRGEYENYQDQQDKMLGEINRVWKHALDMFNRFKKVQEERYKDQHSSNSNVLGKKANRRRNKRAGARSVQKFGDDIAYQQKEFPELNMRTVGGNVKYTAPISKEKRSYPIKYQKPDI